MADEEAEVLLFEPASTVNTGTAGGDKTVVRPDWIWHAGRIARNPVTAARKILPGFFTHEPETPGGGLRLGP